MSHRVSSLHRLALGTVQFGLDYGITNERGRVPREEVAAILKDAESAGVTLLDTAAAYGTAEAVLGELRAPERFRVVTKIQPTAPDDVDALLSESSARLGMERLDTVLLHNAALSIETSDVWNALLRGVASGRVRRAGVSLYAPEEWTRLREICESRGWAYPSTVQLPMSLFDQRFTSLLPELRAAGVEVHLRSLYLQGAAFAEPGALPVYLHGIAPTLELLEDTARNLGVSRATLLIAYGLSHPEVHYLVLGIDRPERLAETIQAYRGAEALLADHERWDRVDSSAFRIDDESIILPTNWN